MIAFSPRSLALILVTAALSLAAIGLPAHADTLTPAQVEQLERARAEAVRMRGFLRAAETQASKAIALIDEALADVEPVEPPIIEPPVVNPTNPDDGWLAREPHADAISLQPGQSIQQAIDTGRDVLLPAGLESSESVAIKTDGQLLGMYGVGNRPIIRGVNVKASGATIVGLHITNPQRNPAAPDFDLRAEETTGVYCDGAYTGLLVEDCVVDWLAKGIVLQHRIMGVDLNGCRDVRINRNIIRYNWAKGDRGAGVYSFRVRGLVVTDNLIDHNGWHPAISGRDGEYHTRGFQAHNCYFSGRYNSGVPDKWDAADNDPAYVVEFRGNVVSRASANGVQFRLGGVVTDNAFIGNPMAFYTWTNRSEVRRNVILDGTHVDMREEFYQRGWGVQIIAAGDYTDNVIANVSEPAAGSWAVVYEHGGANVTGNVFYNWRPIGKASSVWDKNNGGLARVAGNIDTFGDIDATLAAEQIEHIAGRPRGAWGDTFDGAVISAEIRRAYPQ